MIKSSSVLVFVLAGFCCVLSVQTLDLEAAKEGTCKGLNFKPQQDINFTWMEATPLRHISAGSKYHLYRIVANHYDVTMPEYRFYYDSCLQTDHVKGVGITHGFNGDLKGQYELIHLSPGVLDFTPINPETNQTGSDTSRHVLTLTDNKSFIFWANCWKEVDQRSWDVMSLSAEMTPETKTMIEEHAVSLGFKRDNFVFLNYKSCPLIPDSKTGTGEV